MLRIILLLVAGMAIILSGLMAGFFWAWDVAVMNGLGRAEPQVAIAAMQAINANIRNFPFALGFFGTELALIAAAALAFVSRSAVWPTWSLVAGAVIYLFGVIIITLARNAPLNELLSTAQGGSGDPAAIWANYAAPWLGWNRLRILAAIAVLALAASSLMTGAIELATTRRRRRSRPY